MKSRKALAVGVALALLLGGPLTYVGAWSLNPFASNDAPAKPKNPSARAAAQQPSLLSRMGTGTKNFFSKIGRTVTPAKSPPPTHFDLGGRVTATQAASTPPPKNTHSVHDFLSQRRINP